ncbi:unnamed protein product [Phyllotreta striolata]|uniref:NADH dehydrogenase [ubiquinone] 1 subunit C2 n=1 Tax=Phyllotreta striolata TaxID=444603 RepID=A0A9N9XM06_PHYSR|nr:unnamed protein product [Phyllotreta striolata]
MATGPKPATTPLELLSGPLPEQPLLSKYYLPIAGGLMGFIAVVGANYITRRPMFSGIQRHVAGAAAMAGITYIVDNYRNDYYAEKDAVLRHYIQLHPEDFPPFDRKQYKDVLEPWTPIRNN